MPNFVKFKYNLSSYPKLAEYMNSLQGRWSHSLGFDFMPIPDNLWKNDHFLWDIKTKFNGKTVFLRMNANTIYNWHTDLYRNVVINAIIEGFDSFTIFTEKNHEDYIGTSMPVQELTYNPEECCLLNTTIRHAVYNRSSRRTVFSLWFGSKVFYDDVYQYAKSMAYIL